MPKETFDEYKAQMEAMKENKSKNPADLLKLARACGAWRSSRKTARS